MKSTGKDLLGQVKQTAGLPNSQLILPINGFEDYFLRPVATERDLQNSSDVSCFTYWRNRFVNSFLTEFVATEERTATWLAETVHPDDSKILFMIENTQQDRIGYMGLAYIDWANAYGEADAIVKGENAPKGLMSAALKTLLNWAKYQLGLETIGVRVLSDNPALTFYKKLGFEETARIPLKMTIADNSVSWVEDSTLLTSERYLVHHIWQTLDIKISGKNTQMNQIEQFEQERRNRIADYDIDTAFQQQSLTWLHDSMQRMYVYNFDWLGRPIIQYPQDIVCIQELIWRTNPDLIIETGIAHGGSLVLSASMLALLDMSEAIEAGATINPAQSKRKVLGLDIDIRTHNRAAIEAHPMSSRIQMIEGSSIAAEVIEQVKQIAKNYQRILVCLDSNHTHEHVLAELEAYAPLTSVGSYCVVFDTFVEDMPDDLFPNRPWSKGNSPKTAVWEYLKTHDEFEIDKSIQNKLLITVAPDGYLKRVH